ncbi:MAG TPA: hypothetical protein VIV60_27360 [Polyangiaceae bacterium]
MPRVKHPCLALLGVVCCVACAREKHKPSDAVKRAIGSDSTVAAELGTTSLGLIDAESSGCDWPVAKSERRLFTVARRTDGYAIQARSSGPPPFVEEQTQTNLWQLSEGTLSAPGTAQLRDEQGALRCLRIIATFPPAPLPREVEAAWIYATTWVASNGAAYDVIPYPKASSVDPWAIIDVARTKHHNALARRQLEESLGAHQFNPQDLRLLSEARAAELANDVDLASRLYRATHALSACDQQAEDAYGKLSLRTSHIGWYLQIRMHAVERFVHWSASHCGPQPIVSRTNVTALEASGLDVAQWLAGLVIEAGTHLPGNDADASPTNPSLPLSVIAALIRECGRAKEVSNVLLRFIEMPTLDAWNRWRALVVLSQIGLTRPKDSAAFSALPARIRQRCAELSGKSPLSSDWGPCD